MTLKWVRRALLSVILLAGGGHVLADTIQVTLEFEPDLENGARVFEVCASCHLPEGWGHPDGTYPQLAGQHRNVLMRQLLDIRSGKRENNIMFPFVQERTIGGYQSLADVVAYISTLPMAADHGKGPWGPGTAEFARGKKDYGRLCEGCHGQQAEGDDRAGYPKLQRQHYNYLKQQARRIRTGRRQSIIMSPILGSLEEDTVEKVLNYISYIGVPAEQEKAAEAVGSQTKEAK